MNQNAYFLVFDGLADWEAALALSEINKHLRSYQEKYYVEELGVTDENIITASGVGSIEFAYEIIKHLGKPVYCRTVYPPRTLLPLAIRVGMAAHHIRLADRAGLLLNPNHAGLFCPPTARSAL